MLQARLKPDDDPTARLAVDVTCCGEFITPPSYVDKKILEYIVRTRARDARLRAASGSRRLREMVQLGISPRSYQHLLALSRGECVPARPDVGAGRADVKEIFCDATRHRHSPRTVRAQAENVDGRPRFLEELLGAVPIHDPRTRDEGASLHRSLHRAEDPQNQRVGATRVRCAVPGSTSDEHQPYRPGDDVRRIDWNVTARMGRAVRPPHAPRSAR